MANRADAWRAYLRSEEGNPQDKPCKRTYYYVQEKSGVTGFWEYISEPYRYADYRFAEMRAKHYCEDNDLEMYFDVRVMNGVE